jgi:hypothetical protein
MARGVRQPTEGRRGNCYVATEALYHILGGQKGDWKPMRMKVGSETHWFLQHRFWRIRIDPSRLQFRVNDRKRLETMFGADSYDTARGSGFLTKRPSKRARKLMKELTWQKIT